MLSKYVVFASETMYSASASRNLLSILRWWWGFVHRKIKAV